MHSMDFESRPFHTRPRLRAHSPRMSLPSCLLSLYNRKLCIVPEHRNCFRPKQFVNMSVGMVSVTCS